ncbi:hypothetical protein HIM_02178 [Hirsutella minnesotensis 3608]|nr:hypothetical protein HIM_02178 [Hirsutella minnesotensis 3608]
MPRQVHPDTLFHLEPSDEASKAMIHCQDNAPFVSLSPANKVPSLEIGYHVSSRPRGGQVIARLGRDADLFLPGKNVAGVHIAFEVHPVSKAILLRVRAEQSDTVTVAPRNFRRDGSFRQLVLVPGGKHDMSIRTGNSCLKFSVQWPSNPSSVPQAVSNGFQAAQNRAVNPRWLRTADELETESNLRSWYNTKTAVQDNQYRAGSCGTVMKAVDLDSGHFIAVKTVRPRTVRELANVHREIKTMQDLNHPHIIELLGFVEVGNKHGAGRSIAIFMPLRLGNLRNLLPFPAGEAVNLLWALSEQMLSVLDYLAARRLCHRDVKPENILYQLDEKSKPYKFQLADFGLVNHVNFAQTQCGTRLFLAPELHPDYGLKKYPQSPKMDVWSLFMTIASITPSISFDERKLCDGPYSDIVAFAQAVAVNDLEGLEAMARLNPEIRASAAQILVEHYDGRGLTTHRSAVPPIPPLCTESAVARQVRLPQESRLPQPPQAASSRGISSPLTRPVQMETASSSGPFRRWENSSKIGKAKTPTRRGQQAKQREQLSRVRRMPGHFDVEDMEF